MANGSGRRSEIPHLEILIATRLFDIRPATTQSALRQHQSKENYTLLNPKRRTSVLERQIGLREPVRTRHVRSSAKVARRLDDERDQSPGARQSTPFSSSGCKTARDRASA